MNGFKYGKPITGKFAYGPCVQNIPKAIGGKVVVPAVQKHQSDEAQTAEKIQDAISSVSKKVTAFKESLNPGNPGGFFGMDHGQQDSADALAYLTGQLPAYPVLSLKEIQDQFGKPDFLSHAKGGGKSFFMGKLDAAAQLKFGPNANAQILIPLEWLMDSMAPLLEPHGISLKVVAAAATNATMHEYATAPDVVEDFLIKGLTHRLVLFVRKIDKLHAGPPQQAFGFRLRLMLIDAEASAVTGMGAKDLLRHIPAMAAVVEALKAVNCTALEVEPNKYTSPHETFTAPYNAFAYGATAFMPEMAYMDAMYGG